MTTNHKKKLLCLILSAALLVCLAACGAPSEPEVRSDGQQRESTAAPAPTTAPTAAPTAAQTPDSAESPEAEPEEPGADAPSIPGLVYERAMDLRYAEQFDVYYYEGGYKYIASHYDGLGYLIVPEGKTAPQGLDSSVRVLQQPLDDIYLVATAAMSLFDAMDALDVITLCSQNADNWYVKGAAEAMERGEILYGGKYSEPDYELLVNSNIDIAIENTMILHTPKVIEMIEMLGIPVFIENSSYEPHPLGRTEWIKLFGAMIGREDAAQAVFDRSERMMEEIETYPATDKTVAIFLIDTSGRAQVRSPKDYLSKMIGISGGVNAFARLNDDEGGSQANTTMTMEEFYATAMDTDYLIYNASGYSSGVNTIEKMLEMSPLLADCRAVREGNVWWLSPETYQRTDQIAVLIREMHMMLSGEEGETTFLHRME